MADNDAQKTTEDLTVVLHELGNRMERLKQLYEQYFMGIERMEPQVARKEVTRSMMTLQQQYIRNTGLRFKFNSMLQRWNSYTTYWNRTLREIENGTYVRHLQKAARAAKAKGDALPSEMRLRATEDPAKRVEPTVNATPAKPLDAPAVTGEKPMGAPPLPGGRPAGARPALPTSAPPPLPPGASARTGLPPARPAMPPPPPAPTARVAAPAPELATRTAAPRPASAPIPGMSEPELRALHQRYSEARRQAGDAVPVRYETLVASLAKQVPKVLEQPGVRGVKFDVAVTNGKAVLKAIPTK